jgi:hypothetical protein
MDELEEALRQKYGKKVIPLEDVEMELNTIVDKGYIRREDIKEYKAMCVNELIEYISVLRKKFFYDDPSIFESVMDDALRKTFYSFDDSTIVNDLKEKTKKIIGRGELSNESSKLLLIRDVLRRYIMYERKKMSMKRNGWGKAWVCLAYIALIIFVFMTYEGDPF